MKKRMKVLLIIVGILIGLFAAQAHILPVSIDVSKSSGGYEKSIAGKYACQFGTMFIHEHEYNKLRSYNYNSYVPSIDELAKNMTWKGRILETNALISFDGNSYQVFYEGRRYWFDTYYWKVKDIKKADAENMESDFNDGMVKGLVLKYVLLDTAYEIYQANVQTKEVFSQETYEAMGESVGKHYQWLTASYKSMNAENKEYLKVLFESGIHAWGLMDITTRLGDEAGVEDIVHTLTSDSKIKGNLKLKNAINHFLPYFHKNFLKAYLEENENLFNQNVEKLNRQIQENNPDILGFMEQISGIQFQNKFKPVFYYTLRPVGAMGFTWQDLKISTIQRTCSDYSTLFGTPFHEFSHSLFETFTQDKEFTEMAELMKSNKAFQEKWIKDSYDWTGWCEENLVEGFAKYLTYKYYDMDDSRSIYPYDGDFYEYLKKMNFDGQSDSLKEICIEFYQTIVQ